LKITVSHERTREEVKQTINRSLDDVFKGVVSLPVKLARERRAWHGDTLVFSFVAKMGLLSTPISGTLEVTDHELTLEADLGFIERLVPAAKVRQAVASHCKALLK
jgi:hypothetical protein